MREQKQQLKKNKTYTVRLTSRGEKTEKISLEINKLKYSSREQKSAKMRRKYSLKNIWFQINS